MKTWLIRDARAHLGDLVSAALAGEPQRVARRGRQAVVVVSEAEWDKLRPPASKDVPFPPFPLSPEEWDEIKPGPIPVGSRLLFEDV